jgi:predicted transposase YbfD/YdcC
VSSYTDIARPERPLVPVSHAPTSPSSSGDDQAGLVEAAELFELFAQVADPRKARGIRHHIASVLTVTFFAVLAGATNYREAGDRAADLPGVLLQAAAVRRHPVTGTPRAPSGSTIRRVLENIDADAADLLVGRWLAQRARRLAQEACDTEARFGLAMDGKTVRGSGAGDREANVKLFSAMLHREAIVIAQIRVPPATTEVTQVKELLDPVDLTGAVVTGDAAHTRHATAEYLIGRDADYVLTLKANQPTLLGQVAAKLFATADGRHHREEDRSHGRIVHRQIWTAPGDGIDFPGAAQIFRIRRDVFDLAGQRLSKEVVHGITSLTVEQATAQALAGWVRTHWGIENKSHYVRDVVFSEDHQHAYLGASAQAMATFRNLALGLLRLAGITEIKRTLERIAANRTRILPILAASRP